MNRFAAIASLLAASAFTRSAKVDNPYSRNKTANARSKSTTAPASE